MRRYIAYFWYVVRHKFWFMVAWWKCRRYVNFQHWVITHDMSKFSLAEFVPYAKTFYSFNGSSIYDPTDGFENAWDHHCMVNGHHWEGWVLDNGKPLIMQTRYVEEMAIDIMATGKTKFGKWDFHEWYYKNQSSIKIHEKTRVLLEYILNAAENQNLFGTKG